MEGADLVAAGLAAGRRPQVVFLREEAADELGERLGLSGGVARRAVSPVTERVAGAISTLETPADVMAVFAAAGAPAAELAARAARRRPRGRRGCWSSTPTASGPRQRGHAAAGGGGLRRLRPRHRPRVRRPVRAQDGARRAWAPLFGAARVPGACRWPTCVAELPGGDGVRPGRARRRPLAAAALRRPAVLVVGAERAGLSPRGARARRPSSSRSRWRRACAGAVESRSTPASPARSPSTSSRAARPAPRRSAAPPPAAQEG